MIPTPKPNLTFIRNSLLVLLSGLMIPGGRAFAQTAGAKQRPQVRMLARAKKSSIMLRWAVNTPMAWKMSNKYGFRIERYTVLRNNTMLPVPGKVLLSREPVRPKPLEQWASIIRDNNYAAVMAQAIYGKDFEVTGGQQTGMGKLINLSNELDQRFTMSLYAADNSFEAAKYAGWAWEDSTVKWNEKYLYRILPATPDSVLHIDSASAFIGTGSSKDSLPAPSGIGAVFGDRSVMLSWDYSTLKAYYHSYIIERSEDSGRTFHALPGLPVANLNNKEKKPSARLYFIDSLRDNQTSYQYRARGISPFGEQGPPSKAIAGKGRQLLAFVPHIRRGYVDEKGVLQMEWAFDSTGNSLISGFTLSKAATVKGEYRPVAENIAPGERSLHLDSKPDMSSYFTITARGRDGANRTSFPVLVQVIDSMPPAIPAGLTGIIDSNGVVTLRWAPNQEPDLLGYRLFRANNRGEELSVVTGKPYLHTIFRDTVSLNTINNKLYYAVAALDRHYNQSLPSAVIEVKKPDRIPPASPVITAYKIINNTVRLDWINSTDADVAVHELYRKGLADSAGGWRRIARFTDTTHFYTDSKVAGGKTYMYTVIATDSSGLKSPPMPPLTVAIPASPAEKAIHTLSSYVDREHRYIEISWADDRADVREYQLYRGAGDKPVSLWRVVSASSRKRIADEGITINTNYEYGIRAVGRDGAIGPYRSIVVNY